MKGHVADYIKENERAYGYYLHVPGGRWGHLALSIFALVVIFGAVLSTREQFLRQHFLREAGAIDLGRQEVRTWVDTQVTAQKFDYIFWMLLGVTIVTGLWICFVFAKVKSYDLYKRQKRYILPPAITYGVVAVIIIFSSEISRHSIWLIAQIFFEILPVFSAFKLFLPLSMRGGFDGILKLFDVVSQFALKRL